MITNIFITTAAIVRYDGTHNTGI